jgi:hypothetical protein
MRFSTKIGLALRLQRIRRKPMMPARLIRIARTKAKGSVINAVPLTRTAKICVVHIAVFWEFIIITIIVAIMGC